MDRTSALSNGVGGPAESEDGDLPRGSENPTGTDGTPIDGLVGRSHEFRQVIRKVARLASSDATVLITGETGTGKELVAHAIHLQSSRGRAPFIPVNCGALPDNLIENELFGHARGAYTGAEQAGTGLLAEAEGGTLFLDELNSLSLSAQAKVLRLLQNREYRVLGSTRLLTANVRILAATNVDLTRAISRGDFRADLFHRLHVLSLEMPPLRERPTDIPLLLSHFAAAFGALYDKEGAFFSSSAIRFLVDYDWPGNVRELRSVVERAVLMAPGLELNEADTGLGTRAHEVEARHGAKEDMAQAAAGEEFEVFRQAKERTVRQFERGYLFRVMSAVDGNVSQAARLAGMQRRDFQRLLRKHDIRRTRPRVSLRD